MSSPSPQDRLEDTLTDGVFSALRYLPREVLSCWLSKLLPEATRHALTPSAAATAQFEFWPRFADGTEPDLIIRLGSLLIVIEAKYESAFNVSGERHQLAREWTGAYTIARATGMDGPLLIAITNDLIAPTSIVAARAQLRDDDLRTADLDREAAIVWCQWQSVSKALEAASKTSWSAGELAVAGDLTAIMEKRGVNFVYEGFDIADWWLLAAAAKSASTRVYPVIAEFAKEILAQGAAGGLAWGAGDSGVVWFETKQVANNANWHRDYVLLPFWRQDLGVRKQHLWAELYVLFTFNEPSIRVGWSFESSKGTGIVGHSAAIAAWLRNADGDLNVSNAVAWRSRAESVSRDSIDEEWVRASARVGKIRIERVWDPASLPSTAPALELLNSLADSLRDDGSVLRALTDAGIIGPAATPTSV